MTSFLATNHTTTCLTVARVFWSFQIKHDPPPLILFATRSVTVILSTTNRLLQHTMKSTPDQVALNPHSITHWKSVNKWHFRYLTLSKRGVPKSTLCITHHYLSLSNIWCLWLCTVWQAANHPSRDSKQAALESLLWFLLFFISK